MLATTFSDISLQIISMLEIGKKTFCFGFINNRPVRKMWTFFFQGQLVWEKTIYSTVYLHLQLQNYATKFLVCFRYFLKSITVQKKRMFWEPTNRLYIIRLCSTLKTLTHIWIFIEASHCSGSRSVMSYDFNWISIYTIIFSCLYFLF